MTKFSVTVAYTLIFKLILNVIIDFPVVLG